MFHATNDLGVRLLVQTVNNFSDLHQVEFANMVTVYGLRPEHESQVKLTADLEEVLRPYLPMFTERTGVTFGVRSTNRTSVNAIGFRLDLRTDVVLRKKAAWFLRFAALVLAGRVSADASEGRTSDSEQSTSSLHNNASAVGSPGEFIVLDPIGTAMMRSCGGAARESLRRSINEDGPVGHDNEGGQV